MTVGSGSEESVRKLLPRGWHLVVRHRAKAPPGERWLAGAGWLLERSEASGSTREEAIKNLEEGLVEHVLTKTVRSLGWAMIEHDPIDREGYLAFPVTLNNRVVVIVVDLEQGEQLLERARQYVAGWLPNASMVIVPREAVADPARLKEEVESSLSPHRGSE